MRTRPTPCGVHQTTTYEQNGLAAVEDGSEASGNLVLHIQFRPTDMDGAGSGDVENEPEFQAHCGRFDLTEFINAWENLPPLKPPIPIEPPQA